MAEGESEVLPVPQGRYFFSGGIPFTCVDCGACCTGSPGVVRMSEAEVARLAEVLGEAVAAVKQRYLLPHEHGWRIRERANGDCVFFDGRCTVYDARPTQCRTYPFWFQNLRSEERWQATARECPGIGQGRWYSEDEILELLAPEAAE
jgi:uncharacterized protein